MKSDALEKSSSVVIATLSMNEVVYALKSCGAIGSRVVHYVEIGISIVSSRRSGTNPCLILTLLQPSECSGPSLNRNPTVTCFKNYTEFFISGNSTNIGKNIWHTSILTIYRRKPSLTCLPFVYHKRFLNETE